MATRAFAATPVSSLVASIELAVGGAVAFSCAPVSSLAAACDIYGSTQALACAPVTSLNSECSLFSSSVNFGCTPVSSLRACCDLTGTSDMRGMSLCDLVSDLIMMWGIDRRSSAPHYVITRALTDINFALQTMWNRAEERTYWTESTLTLTIPATTSSLALTDSIQNVNGPCRLASDKRNLTPTGTLAELESFIDTYLDGFTSDVPIAYHIERGRQDATDPARCVLHVAPAPVAETNLLLEVTLEAPRYVLGDLATCPLLPIPHRYVESLLLPIARMRASSFYLFSQPDRLPQIEAEFMEASRALGLADPLPGNSGDQRQRRGGEA